MLIEQAEALCELGCVVLKTSAQLVSSVITKLC